MIFHFPVLLYSVFYSLSLGVFTYSAELVYFWLPVLLYSAIYGTLKLGRSWKYFGIPVVFSVSSVGLLALIDSPGQRMIFVVLSGMMFYVSLLGIYRVAQYAKDQTARGLIASSMAATIFYFYAAAYGLYLNFAVPLWLLVVSVCIVTTVVSLQAMILVVSKDTVRAILYSSILGTAMAELFIVLHFWPFGYLTTGVSALIVFYVLWDTANSHFSGILTKRRLVSNLAFFGFLLALLLTSTRWTPIV